MTSPKASLTSRHLAIGYAELTLAQCCVGLNVITGKFLISYLPIFLLLTIRFLIGFIGMTVVTHLQHSSLKHAFKRFMHLNIQDRILLIFQAACGGFLFNIFILYGMHSTSATSAGIITSITPVMIFILAAIFLKEKLTAQKTLAIITAMLGLIIINAGKGADVLAGTLMGNLLVFIAVIPEALFTILSKSVGHKISQIEAVTLVNFFNLILFIPFAGIGLKQQPVAHLSLGIYALLLLYGISGGIMFFLLWYRGLTKINANTAALFTGVMPVSTTIFAAIFLHESIHINDVLGMTVVIIAIFIGCYKFSGSRKKYAA